MSDLREGILLSNRFRLRKQLHHNRTASVWEAADTMSNNTTVVAKIFSSSKNLDPAVVQLLRMELSHVNTLKHPALLQPTFFDVEDPCPFLILPFIEAGSLREKVNLSGPMNERCVVQLIAQVADVISFLHANKVVHQDIIPENILCGDGESFIVSDFGLSRIIHSSCGHVETSQGILHPDYAPPERYSQNIVASSYDVFSLGITLFELIVGELPEKTSVYALAESSWKRLDEKKNYSQVLKSFVRACCHEDIQKRMTADGIRAWLNRYEEAWKQEQNAAQHTSVQNSEDKTVVMPEPLRSADDAHQPSRRMIGKSDDALTDVESILPTSQFQDVQQSRKEISSTDILPKNVKRVAAPDAENMANEITLAPTTPVSRTEHIDTSAVEKLRAVIDEDRSTIGKLKQQLDTMTAQLAHDNIEQMHQENLARRIEVELRRKASEAVQRAEEAESELQALKQSMQEQKESTSKESTLSKNVEEQYRALKKEFEELDARTKRQAHEHDAQINHFELYVREMENEILALRKDRERLETASGEFDSIAEERTKLRSELQEMQSAYSNEKLRGASRQKDFDAYAAQMNEKLLAMQEQSEARLQDANERHTLKRELHQWKREIENQQGEIARALRIADEEHRLREEETTRNENLSLINASLKEEVRSLKDNVDEVQLRLAQKEQFIFHENERVVKQQVYLKDELEKTKEIETILREQLEEERRKRKEILVLLQALEEREKKSFSEKLSLQQELDLRRSAEDLSARRYSEISERFEEEERKRKAVEQVNRELSASLKHLETENAAHEEHIRTLKKTIEESSHNKKKADESLHRLEAEAEQWQKERTKLQVKSGHLMDELEIRRKMDEVRKQFDREKRRLSDLRKRMEYETNTLNQLHQQTAFMTSQNSGATRDKDVSSDSGESPQKRKSKSKQPDSPLQKELIEQQELLNTLDEERLHLEEEVKLLDEQITLFGQELRALLKK